MGHIGEFSYLVDVNVRFKSSNDDGLNTFVDCIVNADKFRLWPFNFDVYVRSFHLNFKLSHARSPLSSWAYATQILGSKKFKKKIVENNKQKFEYDNELKFEAKLDAGANRASKVEQKQMSESENHMDAETEDIEERISCRGSDKHPSWSFVTLNHEDHLKGCLLNNFCLFKTYANNDMANVKVTVDFPNDGLIIRNNYSRSIKQTTNLNIGALLLRWKLRRKAHELLDLSLKED